MLNIINFIKSFVMGKSTGIVFINWGRSDYETNREIVMTDSADAVFEEIYDTLPLRGWISMNETYVSFDKRIEQGKCLLYKNKMQ